MCWDCSGGQSELCGGTLELCGKISSFHFPGTLSSFITFLHSGINILAIGFLLLPVLLDPEDHNFLLISLDVNAPTERNNLMLLLQHECCYLSLLMAKYLCQRKFTADHLVLAVNTANVIYWQHQKRHRVASECERDACISILCGSYKWKLYIATASTVLEQQGSDAFCWESRPVCFLDVEAHLCHGLGWLPMCCSRTGNTGTVGQ